MDYRRYYDLESYLFEDVRKRFASDRYLSAFDFFSIVVWKSNRSKSRIAAKLCRLSGTSNLDEAVRKLSTDLAGASDQKDRLRILLEEWEFYLPMASAILAVLWPDEFTIYDIRACNALDDFHNLGNSQKIGTVWPRYQEFCDAIHQTGGLDLSLRDADRFIWGKSVAGELERDIERGFSKIEKSA